MYILKLSEFISWVGRFVFFWCRTMVLYDIFPSFEKCPRAFLLHATQFLVLYILIFSQSVNFQLTFWQPFRSSFCALLVLLEFYWRLLSNEIKFAWFELLCRWLSEAGNLPTFSHLDRDLLNSDFAQIRCLWKVCNVNFFDLIYFVSFGFLFD